MDDSFVHIAHSLLSPSVDTQTPDSGTFYLWSPSAWIHICMFLISLPGGNSAVQISHWPARSFLRTSQTDHPRLPLPLLFPHTAHTHPGFNERVNIPPLQRVTVDPCKNLSTLDPPLSTLFPLCVRLCHFSVYRDCRLISTFPSIHSHSQWPHRGQTRPGEFNYLWAQKARTQHFITAWHLHRLCDSSHRGP